MKNLFAIAITFLQLISAVLASNEWVYPNPNSQCMQVHESNADCETEVSISCTILEAFDHPSLKVGGSCLDEHFKSEEGFFSESGDYDSGGADWNVKVKIIFKITNSIPSQNIILDTEESFSKIGNNQYFFNNDVLLPTKSKTISKEEVWDLKDVSDAGRRRRKLFVNFKGRINVVGDERNCYCYTFRTSTNFFKNDDATVIAPPPPLLVPAPSPSPTLIPDVVPDVPVPSPPAPGKGSKGKGKGKDQADGARTLRQRRRSKL